jgi:hypothetical protein
MAISEETFLLDCWDRVICPYCRTTFPPTQRVGSGKKQEGGFCSLGCYAKYYELTLAERHQHRLKD